MPGSPGLPAGSSRRILFQSRHPTGEEVKRALPNVAAVSVAEGTRILRETTLKEFAAAADEMEIRLKEAQQRATQAQSGGSAADQQATVKQLQQVQLEQAEKLKEITARLSARIAALQQLKKE